MLRAATAPILALALATAAAPALAQTVTYDSGSIYDLDPPARQSTGPEGQVFEQIVSSRAAHRMQEVRDLGRGDILRKLARPVGRLAIGLPGGKISFCTASLVADDLVLTNHHCIPGLGTHGAVTEAMLWMGYLYPASLEGVAQYPVDTKPVEADKALDYALLRVRGRPGGLWGKVTLQAAEPEAGGTLFIVHHPGGATQHITRGGCQAGDPATIGDDIRHICDTLQGSSGAPIFDNNTRAVIGLHNRAAGPGVNAGKRIASLRKASPTLARLMAVEAPRAVAAPAVAPKAAQTSKATAELVWPSVQGTTSPSILDAFAAEYPGTIYARLAAARAKELREPKVAALAPPVVAPVPNCTGIRTSVAGKGMVCLDPADPAKRAFQDCTGGFCGPKLVALPTGSYKRGSEDGESDEKPVREVTIGYHLAVGKFEVTFAEWDACVQAGGCTHKPGDQGWGRGKRPVINVSWDDAVAYVGWLSNKIGQPYRLLSEAEWEYAARGVTSASARHTTYSWGDAIGKGNANCNCGSQWDNKKTAPVGQFDPNRFGLHDMHGNVWEWVQDCWADSYSKAPTNGNKAPDTNACSRVVRGGSWGSYPRYLRSANRIGVRPDDRNDYIGFRVARSLSR